MWLLTDRSYKFLTQREYPALALIETRLEFDDSEGWVDSTTESSDKTRLGWHRKGWLVLKAPGMEEELRVRFPREPKQDDSSYPALVFEESVWAFDEGEEASTWLSKYLYPLHGVRLCVKDTATPRYSDRKYLPDDLKGWSQTAFPDLTPLLVCTAASISDFDRRIHERNPDLPTLDARNVRPNIVVEGSDAYAEDQWKVVRIGSTPEGQVTLHGCRLMIRCQMPCVDHAAGKMDRTWTALKT
ncbi:hypothetical protein HDU93_006501, partial [Gonapodya sp. JEL0774]